ncbi:molybdopterin-dependent oxidoreductase [Halomonas beimenensis]|nr:molybdopterin-dependent oxidoreductase [Halomonas beimenensis]
MMSLHRLTLAGLLAAALAPALTTVAEPILTIQQGAESRELTLAEIERSEAARVTMRHFEGPEGTFDGVWLEDFLADQGLDEAGRLRFIAIDDYTTFLTPHDRQERDYMLATRLDGEPLRPDQLGPLMLVVPADAEAVLEGEAPMSQWIWAIREIQAR